MERPGQQRRGSLTLEARNYIIKFPKGIVRQTGDEVSAAFYECQQSVIVRVANLWTEFGA